MKIDVGKIPTGHQANTHQIHDSRPKRRRTRQAQRSAWRREYTN
jgi:hypothetical protein